MNKLKLLILSFRLILILFTGIGISACTPGVNSVEEVENQPSPEAAGDDSGNESDEDAEKQVATEANPEQDAEPDIEASWLASPHADAFVLDTEGNNNSCARCHAPVNWLPSMDDLPESCFACKFELEDPPAYISEVDWVDIPCFVCHEKDKKDNIQPEYTWLEIAAIEEYSKVDTPTELCQKCHNELELPGHAVSQLAGAHSEYECTDCHDAHDTVASCGSVYCHEDVFEPVEPISGHDEDHQLVSCQACHDGDELLVAPDAEDGVWKTYVDVPPEGVNEPIAFTSHNIILEVSCDRCHFIENPWGLTDNAHLP